MSKRLEDEETRVQCDVLGHAGAFGLLLGAALGQVEQNDVTDHENAPLVLVPQVLRALSHL